MKFNNRNVWIDPSAKIGEGVRIGDNAVIYANVEIGDRTVIANDCVIGEPLSSYYDSDDYVQPETIIGSDSLIRSHAIIYASAKIGDHFSCGHRVIIRENSTIGTHSRVGSFSDIQDGVVIENYVWFHSGVFVPRHSIIRDFVFLYPGVSIANDLYPPSEMETGVEIDEFVQIGIKTVINPGLKIGKCAVVGSASLVTSEISAYSCAVGTPARHVKDVREIKMPDGSQAYPWPKRFDRGMPWEGIGFEQWQATNESL